ncbi:MAG TPA: hypothetical protein VMT85_10880 [Thermoanaerobaculia bacterium]|nr:hypothetical protein [Thermoanaerobaculia bacterium]
MPPRDSSAGAAAPLSASEWNRLVVPGAAATLIGFGSSLTLAALPSVQDADGAEIRYLGRLALLVLLLLLPTAALAPARRSLGAWSVGVVGSGALLWTLPAGPLRGAAISSLLVLIFLSVVLAERAGGLAAQGISGRLMPAALALQCLALPAELLAFPLDARALVRLFALPLAACVLVLLVARQRGVATAALAALSALAVSGRFSAAVLVALLVPLLAPQLVGSDRPLGRRLLAFGALAAPFALDPVLGALALLGVLALLGRRAWPAALVVATGLLTLGPSSRSWVEAAALLPTLLLVAPWGAVRLLRALARGERDAVAAFTWSIAVSLALGWIGLRFGDPSTALAIPVVLMAVGPAVLSVSEPRRRGRDQTSLELVWPSLWLAGSVLAGSYPWLRPPGAHSLLERLGLLAPPWLPLALAAAVVVMLGPAMKRPRTGAVQAGFVRAPTWPVAGAIALFLAVPILRLGDATFVLTWPAVELDREHPVWTSDELGTGGGDLFVVVDSAVAYGAEVTAGAALATVRWRPDAGEGEATTTLRHGLETAEWTASASARPGLAPWLSLIAPDGGSFVHRYRAQRSLGVQAPGRGRLTVELGTGLPAALRLSLYRVTLVSAGSVDPDAGDSSSSIVGSDTAGNETAGEPEPPGAAFGAAR